MLKFFDYMYYKVGEFYYKKKGNNPRITALVIVALVQTLNIILLFFLYSVFFKVKINIDKVIGVCLLFLLIVLNGIRYNKLHYDILKEKWKHKEEKWKIKKEIFILIYIVLTIALFFGVAIYLNNKK